MRVDTSLKQVQMILEVAQNRRGPSEETVNNACWLVATRNSWTNFIVPPLQGTLGVKLEAIKCSIGLNHLDSRPSHFLLLN
jgi:hypothetical protein